MLVFGSVTADSVNAMMPVRATAFAMDTAAVECGLVSLDSNRHWMLIDGTHQSICTGTLINEAGETWSTRGPERLEMSGNIISRDATKPKPHMPLNL